MNQPTISMRAMNRTAGREEGVVEEGSSGTHLTCTEFSCIPIPLSSACTKSFGYLNYPRDSDLVLSRNRSLWSILELEKFNGVIPTHGLLIRVAQPIDSIPPFSPLFAPFVSSVDTINNSIDAQSIVNPRTGRGRYTFMQSLRVSSQ
jgi:hypothetical protein